MKTTRIIFGLFVLITMVLAFMLYRWILDYLLFSIIFAYVLAPSVSWLERKGLPRWMGITFIYSTILMGIAWLTYTFIPELVEQGNNLLELLSSEHSVSESILALPIIRSLHASLTYLDAQVPVLSLTKGLTNSLDMLEDMMVKLPSLIFDNYQLIIGALSFVATIPLIGFFLLKDGNKLIKDFFRIIPNRYFELVIITVNKLNETIGNFLRAMVFEVISVTLMASLALSIVGVKNAVLIGLIAGIANIIPYFGPFIGTLVAVVSVLVGGNTALMPIVNIVIAMYVVQMIDNNIVYPVVVGTAIKMHPLIVLLTVLAGGWYGGIIWMLISVPLVYFVFNIVQVLYVNLKNFDLI